jgi:Flp pilus assembly protein TadG
MRNLRLHTQARRQHRRRGNSAMDYMLILATLLPMVLFIVVKGKRMMQLVWEMLCVLVSWPLM